MPAAAWAALKPATPPPTTSTVFSMVSDRGFGRMFFAARPVLPGLPDRRAARLGAEPRVHDDRLRAALLRQGLQPVRLDCGTDLAAGAQKKAYVFHHALLLAATDAFAAAH